MDNRQKVKLWVFSYSHNSFLCSFQVRQSAPQGQKMGSAGLEPPANTKNPQHRFIIIQIYFYCMQRNVNCKGQIFKKHCLYQFSMLIHYNLLAQLQYIRIIYIRLSIHRSMVYLHIIQIWNMYNKYAREFLREICITPTKQQK